MKPFRVLIEGADATGKSTLVKNLVAGWTARYGRPVAHLFDPGVSHNLVHQQWQKMREFVKTHHMDRNTETLMFFAMRAELEAVAKGQMEAGNDIVQDRGHISTMVYQGYVKGNAMLVGKLNQCCDFPKPDLTIVLDAPFEVLNARLEKRATNIDKFKGNTDFRKAVWLAYKSLAPKYAVVIDASGDEQQVLSDVFLAIDGHIAQQNSFCPITGF